jgi:hypothetical protein
MIWIRKDMDRGITNYLKNERTEKIIDIKINKLVEEKDPLL